MYDIKVNEIFFAYNKNCHKITGHLYYDKILFSAEAICHPMDYAFESKKTGEKICAIKLSIKIIEYLVQKTKHEIDAISTVLNSISSQRNDYCYMLTSRLRDRKLKLYHDLVADKRKLKNDLHFIIQQKNTLYRHIESSRKNSH